MKSRAIVPLLILTSTASAQDYLYRFTSPFPGNTNLKTGRTVAGLDDLNGDGVGELAYRAPGPAGGFSIYVVSGADGTVHFQKDFSFSTIGEQIASVGDVDADGVPDVVVDADPPTSTGHLRVWSGATGQKIYFVYPPSGSLGPAVPFGDADADGHEDFLTTNFISGQSRFVLVSGQSGDQQQIAVHGSFSTSLGKALAAVDLDGDGALDFVAGGFDLVGAYRRDGTPLYTIVPDVTNQNFGLELVGLGDVTGDGCDDFVVSALYADYAGRDTGSVWLYSGKDGTELKRWDGTQVKELMGRSLGSADTDGDGIQDVLIGSWSGSSLLGGSGSFRIVSGATLEVLYEVRDPGPLNNLLGFDVAGLDDLDGDGRDEVFLGNITKQFGTLYQAGEAAVWRGFQDGNQNGIEDRAEYTQELDLNLDGLLDEGQPLVEVYCTETSGAQSCDLIVGGFGVATIAPGPDPLILTARNARTSTSALLFYGLSGPAAIPFLGGTLCVQPPLSRTPPVLVKGPGYLTCSGDVVFDFADRLASGVDPDLVAGATVNVQWWAREPLAPEGVELSEGLEFPILP